MPICGWAFHFILYILWLLRATLLPYERANDDWRLGPEDR